MWEQLANLLVEIVPARFGLFMGAQVVLERDLLSGMLKRLIRQPDPAGTTTTGVRRTCFDTDCITQQNKA